jgi:hypothetical protein
MSRREPPPLRRQLPSSFFFGPSLPIPAGRPYSHAVPALDCGHGDKVRWLTLEFVACHLGPRRA